MLRDDKPKTQKSNSKPAPKKQVSKTTTSTTEKKPEAKKSPEAPKTSRGTDKPYTVGKVYDKNDLLLGEIQMMTKSKNFSFIWKSGKEKSIYAKSLPELTDREMKGKVQWMYIRYKRDKVFNIKDHVKPSKDKKLCWKDSEFYA